MNISGQVTGITLASAGNPWAFLANAYVDGANSKLENLWRNHQSGAIALWRVHGAPVEGYTISTPGVSWVIEPGISSNSSLP
jgi:hypothetical protein